MNSTPTEVGAGTFPNDFASLSFGDLPSSDSMVMKTSNDSKQNGLFPHEHHEGFHWTGYTVLDV